MDRRGFLLGLSAIAVAGCARVPPGTAVVTPSATPSAAPTLRIGHGGSPAGELLARLLAEALVADGGSASAVPFGEDWRAPLGHGDLAAVPAFAATLWAGLSKADEPPSPKRLLNEVAALVAPEISVLRMPALDARLVWLVTGATAEAGITSLSRVGSWSPGRTAAVPPFAVSRADGIPGLRAVYGARFSVAQVADPVERALRLTSGAAEIAAFRRTEYTGASGLVELVDTERLAVADPGIVLVNTTLTDTQPERVLAMDAVAQAVTTEHLLVLQARVAAGGDPGDVAREWLDTHGLR